MKDQDGELWRDGIHIVVCVRAMGHAEALAIVRDKMGPDYLIESMSGYAAYQARTYKRRKPQVPKKLL